MKIVEWLGRKNIKPINVMRGDTITLISNGKDLLTSEVKDAMKITEVGIFLGEIEKRKCLGGIFMEDKKNTKIIE